MSFMSARLASANALAVVLPQLAVAQDARSAAYGEPTPVPEPSASMNLPVGAARVAGLSIDERA